ncbi:kelch-like protein 24 [Branchiostoma floridae]|uniref:Kelch-like protein 24 n=1 Tax=Branchiostoma floridae TaxID=7739 RepID=A0A9J7MVJ0_BRAFL|nr:kelch-like protein 24 [Branchiostoma floridae]
MAPRFQDFCHYPHAASLLKGLQELRSDNLLTDVILCVSGKEIPCHRNVLAACSGYFHAMFCNGHRESQEHKVTIHEVSTNILQLLVDYAYTSKIKITEDNAVKLLEGASFFQIQPVHEACVTFVSNNLSSKNCLKMVHMGSMLSCPDLEKRAWTFVMRRFAAVSTTPDFLYLTKEQLVKLISSDDLNASEEVIYKAVTAWINHDTRKRKREMKELMELIRFPFMDRLYFMENVESNDAVRKACQDIVTETRKYQLFPGEVQSPRTRPRRASGLRETVVVIGGTELQETGPTNAIMTTTVTNPSESSWTVMTRMKRNGDSGFAVAVLGKSDIIVSTGTSFAKDVWLYQPELDSWSRLAKMIRDRCYHKLAVVQGKVYAIGGQESGIPQSRLEVYDRNQNKWTEGIPLPEPRYGHAAVVLDGRIYVMGGFDADGEATSTAYRFTPGDDKWTTMENMPAVGGHVTAAVLKGSIYVAGLQAGMMYRLVPKEDQWISWGRTGPGWGVYKLQAPVKSMCGMTAYQGKIYIFGGKTESGGSKQVTCYDPETKVFRNAGNMPKALYGHACVTILKCC